MRSTGRAGSIVHVRAGTHHAWPSDAGDTIDADYPLDRGNSYCQVANFPCDIRA